VSRGEKGRFLDDFAVSRGEMGVILLGVVIFAILDGMKADRGG